MLNYKGHGDPFGERQQPVEVPAGSGAQKKGIVKVSENNFMRNFKTEVKTGTVSRDE